MIKNNDMLRICTERTHLRNPSVNVILKATILTIYNEKNFIATIAALQSKRPLLTSTIRMNKDGLAFYRYNTAPVIPVTSIQRRSRSQWIEIAGEENRIPFRLSQEALLRIYILYDQEEFDILLIAHHLLGDGLALVNLLKDINKHYQGNHSIDNDIPQLINRQEDIPKAGQMHFISRLYIKNLNFCWQKSAKIFSEDDYHQMFRTYHHKYHTNIKTFTLPKSDYLDLIGRCRQHHITVNSALTAAFLLARGTLPAHAHIHKQKIKTGIAINMRKDLPFSGTSKLGNYASAFSINYSYRNVSFWEHARNINALIYKKINSLKSVWLLLSMYYNLNQNLTDATYFAAFNGFESPAALSAAKMIGMIDTRSSGAISNLGKINILPADKLTGLVFVPPKTPSANIVMGAAAVNDRLAISLQYDKALFTDSHIIQILSKINHYLTT